jgi:hypothetical protein
MKIENVAQPSLTPVHGTNTQYQQSAREKAIAMMQSQAQQTPVQNPSNITPEEMTAIKAPSKQEHTQKSNNESPSSPEVAADTKTSTEPLSSQYAILARKEKQLRLRDQQLRQREAAIKAASEKPATPPSAPSIDESKYIALEKLKQDPIRTLLESGLTYEQLTEAAINGPRQEDMHTQNELRLLREEIAKLKGETESTKKSFEEQQTAQRQQAERQIRSDVVRLVQQDPAFETIKETRSVGDVVELITKTFDEDGILLTVEEAAQQVEDYLIDEALKLSKLKKIQQRMQPASTQPQKSTAQPQQQQMKTLTNSVGSNRPLSAKERALLAFEGKLTK